MCSRQVEDPGGHKPRSFEKSVVPSERGVAWRDDRKLNGVTQGGLNELEDGLYCVVGAERSWDIVTHELEL